MKMSFPCLFFFFLNLPELYFYGTHIGKDEMIVNILGQGAL